MCQGSVAVASDHAVGGAGDDEGDLAADRSCIAICPSGAQDANRFLWHERCQQVIEEVRARFGPQAVRSPSAPTSNPG